MSNYECNSVKSIEFLNKKRKKFRRNVKYMIAINKIHFDLPSNIFKIKYQKLSHKVLKLF